MAKVECSSTGQASPSPLALRALSALSEPVVETAHKAWACSLKPHKIKFHKTIDLETQKETSLVIQMSTMNRAFLKGMLIGNLFTLNSKVLFFT